MRYFVIGSVLASGLFFALIGYFAVEKNPMHALIGAGVGGVIGYVEARVLGGMIARKQAELKGPDHE